MVEPTYQDWKDRMAKTVRYRIAAMGITPRTVARRSGLPLRYIEAILEAKSYPSLKARSLLAPVLGCTLEYVKPKGD